MINRYFTLNFMKDSTQVGCTTAHFDDNVLFILTVLDSKSKLRSLFNPRTSTLTMLNGFYHKKDKKNTHRFRWKKMRIENRSALDQKSQTTLSAKNTNAKRLFICNTKRQGVIKNWNEYIDGIKRMPWREQYSHCAALQFLFTYFYIGMSTKAQMKSFRMDLNYFVLFFTLLRIKKVEKIIAFPCITN